MLPKIIIHNSVSLDGSFVNFEVNMGLHYRIAQNYKADAHLIGSNTMKIGIEMFGGAPPEEKEDFNKPEKDADLPYWVIPNTKGILKGLHHVYRRFEFCREVVVLISEETPEEYREYLEERNYDYHVLGKTRVDLKKALELLADKYGIKTVLADTGRILGNILLNLGLAKEISLLIHPVIVGSKGENLFSNIDNSLKLKKERCEVLDSEYVWLVYKVDS